MRKVFAIIGIFVYMTMTNAVIHAESIGVFSHTPNMQTSETHCHHTETSTSSSQGIDCCELVVSNQYNQTEVKFRSISKTVSFAISPVSIPTDVALNMTNFYKPISFVRPGWDPNIKYQKFSDLMGIVVDIA